MQDNVEDREDDNLTDEEERLNESSGEATAPNGAHQLEDIARKMKRNAQEAMNLVVKEMRKKDNDIHHRLSLAKQLMEYNLKIVDQINRDSLNRAILELRQKDLALKQVPLKPVGDDSNIPSAPGLKNMNLVDFSTV